MRSRERPYRRPFLIAHEVLAIAAVVFYVDLLVARAGVAVRTARRASTGPKPG